MKKTGEGIAIAESNEVKQLKCFGHLNKIFQARWPNKTWKWAPTRIKGWT